LAPASVITDNSNDRDVESAKGVELHHAESARAVAPEEPHLTAGMDQLRGHGKAGSNSQSTIQAWLSEGRSQTAMFRTRVEPAERAASLDVVSNRGNKVTAVTN